MKRLILSVALLWSMNVYSQVVINEVCTSNKNGVKDNDGDSPDWIELYNAGASAVDLTGYRLSDDAANNNKWVFPSMNIPANGYLTVFASGKNVVNNINHWEALVLEENTWKYTVPTSNITDWTKTSFNDASWSSGAGGIGYGDNDDVTIVPTSVSLYARKSFTITDKTQIESLKLLMDYDDGFIAYLNGVEIARGNMVAGTPAYNAVNGTGTGREALVYSGGAREEFTIPKSAFDAYLVNGSNVLAIEVHNETTVSSDMTMRATLLASLTSAGTTYQALPSYFTPPVTTYNIHTNFKLSASGTVVLLYSPTGSLVNGVSVPTLRTDDSYGRFPNGSATLKYLNPVTYNASNASSTSYSGYWTDVVTFSVPSGFYQSGQSITLTKVSAGSTIRYTTDGSIPTANSTVYTSPIYVSQNTVVRAACFATGYMAGAVETNTYFINQSVSLPVISLSTDPAGFFSEQTGIYVDGPASVTSQCPAEPHSCYNYWQEWERAIHFEYFDINKTQKYEQDAGAKILGGWTRMLPVKSLQIRALDGKFKYPFFTEPNKSHIKEFETFTLRSGGNDYESTLLRDAVNHRVLNANTCYENSIDFEAYTPVVVFINGAYWGIHTMRERKDKSFFENNFGTDKVDWLEFDGTQPIHIKRGTNSEWINTKDFVLNNDMSIANNYTQASSMIDMDNYVDYFAAEIYHTNWDWPHNNIMYWKAKTPGSKWRFIYHDTDFAYGLFNFSSATIDELNRMITDTTTKKNVHTPMLLSFLKNTTFRTKFLNRFADLMNTTYNSTNIKALYDNLATEINPEVDRHLAKWGNASKGAIGGSRYAWESNKNFVKDFMTNRNGSIRSQFVSRYGLNGTTTVTLNTNIVGAGKIKFNTIAPCTYPFTGTYFQTLPINVEVTANPGYVFTGWTSSVSNVNNTTATSFTVTLNSGTATFTANFATTTNIPKLTFSEINYQSDTLPANDAGDWIEVHNYGNASIDLSGWKMMDNGVFKKYVIPQGTVLSAGGYLVLVSDQVKFKTVNPNVSNFKGDLGFNLSNDGETVRLIDNFNTQRLIVTYNDAIPWPLLANGKGSTLELLSDNADLNLYSSWKDGCLKGSPGVAFFNCPVTAIDPDELKENQVVVFKEYASGNLVVKSSNTISQVKLYNLFGARVDDKNEVNDVRTEIEGNKVAAGLYIIKVQLLDGTSYTQKIVVE